MTRKLSRCIFIVAAALGLAHCAQPSAETSTGGDAQKSAATAAGNTSLASQLVTLSTQDPGASSADQQAVATDLGNLPDDVLQFMQSDGITIMVGPGFAANVQPDLASAGTRDRPGDSWFTLPGTSQGKTVIIGTMAGPNGGRAVNTQNQGSFNVLFHELGHVINYSGHYGSSTDADFTTAWNSDFSRLQPYFQQANGAGADESFAEGFSRYEGDDTTLPTDWPALYTWFKGHLPAPRGVNAGLGTASGATATAEQPSAGTTQTTPGTTQTTTAQGTPSLGATQDGNSAQPSTTTTATTATATTQPTTATAPTGQCTDNNGYCASWAASGQCQANPGYMLTNCCASCGGQGTAAPATAAPAGQCTDNNGYCASWAASGQCEANPGYMLTQCCASCQGK